LRGKDQRRAERARSLRRALTPAEFALWTRIRGRQLGGFKFVRQQPIDRYFSERPEDSQRDCELRVLGYRVIRIWNNDVIENLDRVLERLLSELEKAPLTPSLSPQAGRGR
jgi:very-short-patch-repair endonuclease